MKRHSLTKWTALFLAMGLTLSLSGCGAEEGKSTASIPTKEPEVTQTPKEEQLQQAILGGNGMTAGSKPSEAPKPLEEPKPEELPEPIEPSYTELIKYLEDNEYQCAIAMFGYSDSPNWKDGFQAMYGADGHLEDYPFMAQIPEERFIETEGSQLYCIVPADPNATLAVNEWIIPDGSGQQGYAGDVLYRSESGDPIILRGNADETTANLQINLTDSEGQTITLYPMLNPMDGSILLADLSDRVLDFTYGVNLDTELPDVTVDSISMEDLYGSWAAWGFYDSEGNEYVYTLELYYDYNSGQDLIFSIHTPEGDLVKCYEGAYYNADDIDLAPDPSNLRFDLMLVMGEGSDQMRPPMLSGVFSVIPSLDADLFTLAHLSGDPLVSGMENAWIAFNRAMG